MGKPFQRSISTYSGAGLLLFGILTTTSAWADEPAANDAPPPSTSTSSSPPEAAPTQPAQSTPAPMRQTWRVVSPNAEPNHSSTRKPRKWYGLPSLVGVAASHAMIAGGLFGGGFLMLGAGSLGAIFTTPITHWANGSLGQGFASLGGNIAAPFFGGLIGVSVGRTDWHTLGGIWIGGALWHAADIAFLHYHEKPWHQSSRTPRLQPSFAVVPMMDRNISGISVVGQF